MRTNSGVKPKMKGNAVFTALLFLLCTLPAFSIDSMSFEHPVPEPVEWVVPEPVEWAVPELVEWVVPEPVEWVVPELVEWAHSLKGQSTDRNTFSRQARDDARLRDRKGQSTDCTTSRLRSELTR